MGSGRALHHRRDDGLVDSNTWALQQRLHINCPKWLVPDQHYFTHRVPTFVTAAVSRQVP